MTRAIIVTLEFEGFHRWPDAPHHVAYLRDLHRHLFKVRAARRIEGDREIEFITFKGELGSWIRETQVATDVSTWSCETWAEQLLRRFDLIWCEVYEDGENGSRVDA